MHTGAREVHWNVNARFSFGLHSNECFRASYEGMLAGLLMVSYHYMYTLLNFGQFELLGRVESSCQLHAALEGLTARAYRLGDMILSLVKQICLQQNKMAFEFLKTLLELQAANWYSGPVWDWI